jgi:hypothetical protein
MPFARSRILPLPDARMRRVPNWKPRSNHREQRSMDCRAYQGGQAGLEREFNAYKGSKFRTGEIRSAYLIRAEVIG